jgi:hypothetical protein
MALEQRQTQIETGAGLTESRLNRDFVDFLKKWSTPILLVIAAVVVGIWAFKQMREASRQKTVNAYTDLDVNLSQSVKPETMVQLATEHAGQGSVPHMARLAAADAWMMSAYRGLKPGAELEAGGKVKDAADVLDDAGIKDALSKANEQYNLVANATAGDAGKIILNLRAKFGLAAVAETMGNWDAAKGYLNEAQKLAESGGFPDKAKLAQARLATIDELKNTPTLIDADKVKTNPAASTPSTTSLNLPASITGNPNIKVEQVDKPPFEVDPSKLPKPKAPGDAPKP